METQQFFTSNDLPNVQEAPAQLHILSSRTIHEEEKGLTFRQDDL
jgi:hypothetical protein